MKITLRLPSEPKHGTRSTYVHRGCRCAACVAADRDYQNEIGRRRDGLLEQAPTDPRHGTLNGYTNWRCQCDRCRAVKRKYDAAHRRTQR